ncbi:MAG: ExeA family protein [Acidobacteriota bacterium]
MSNDSGYYLGHWNLTGRPFENVPDPESFYLSESHAWALNLLEYALQEHKAAALLTGEYGSGKTTMIRVLLNRLDLELFNTVLINYPMLEGKALFRHILEQLDDGSQPEEVEKSELYNLLGNRFIENARNGQHNLVVLDEAQSLPLDSLFEELRLLLNYQLNDRNLVTLLLAGQDDLWNRVSNIPQLAQRFAVKCRLQEFDLNQTMVYISYRLERCGGSRQIFTVAALELIHRNSNGIPRRINNLCDLALMMGCQRKLQVIGPDIIGSIWV